MKLSVIIIVIFFLVMIFGSYPKKISFQETKNIKYELRTFECIKENSGELQCPIKILNISAQNEIKKIEEILSTLWCPFIPLSYEGQPEIKLLFQSISGNYMEIGVRGKELSNGCFLPKKARKFLNRIGNNDLIEVGYEKL